MCYILLLLLFSLLVHSVYGQFVSAVFTLGLSVGPRVLLFCFRDLSRDIFRDIGPALGIGVGKKGFFCRS